MATSESDDFESADEELGARTESINRRKKYASIGSDSDDDVDFIPVQPKTRRGSNKTPYQQNFGNLDINKESAHKEVKMEVVSPENGDTESSINAKTENQPHDIVSDKGINSCKVPNVENEVTYNAISDKSEKLKQTPSSRDRKQKQNKPRETQTRVKKLGATKIEKFPDMMNTASGGMAKDSDKDTQIPQSSENCKGGNTKHFGGKVDIQQSEKDKGNSRLEVKEDSDNMPEELKSNLKFKDIFKPIGWESLGDDIKLPNDLSDDKYHPVLEKLANSQADTDVDESWGAWGSWGVSSLLNSASAGVSTLTSHVSQGLSLLEESMGVPDPMDLAEDAPEEQPALVENETEHQDESPSLYLPSFGFGDLISSVSSLTKYVESTSNRVISGGLDTLETIGKKTMEVLQEGDPGLKKKRAFFANDVDKPILSQILREAKEKADIEEKSVEEKELARKIHFESLFDDYQGLVHLEALEMLSKQCNIKIQNQLISLDESDLTSIQETLDEVKELCDLGDEDSDEDLQQANRDFVEKLQEASKDLGVPVLYEKLTDIWFEMNKEVSPESEYSQREIFQKAISALARFTAYSVERFHKTAELLLIKERRSTVNEADSLVQLTRILSSQIGSIANLYCRRLKDLSEEGEKSESNESITSIFLEATNASSYVQEAFRLLIPILQVGAI